jgi:hypothetical protein
MSIARWWRKLRAKTRRAAGMRLSNEEGITARVDMVRLEALGEAAFSAMYDSRQHGARDCFEDARYHFERAIEAARRAGLHEEAARLKRRRDHVARVYNHQFRYS